MLKQSYTKEKIDLGYGGMVTYLKNFVTKNNANLLFEELFDNLEWKQFTYTINNKEVNSPRLMHIFKFEEDDDMDDLPLFAELKKRIEKKTHRTFTYAVLNYYRDGKDYIGFHDDKEVKPGTAVVSVSLGSRRKFILKHKFNEKVKFEFMLRNGDVLLLNESAIKTNFKHGVPKMANVGARISITFRE
jgi:alkylated DNA repair dioxygenase AlkB